MNDVNIQSRVQDFIKVVKDQVSCICHKSWYYIPGMYYLQGLGKKKNNDFLSNLIT